MVDVGLVLSQMEGTKLSLVILDACRNNPFGSRGLRAVQGGLGQMQAPEGTLISFATQPGNVAQDGADGHSPYTKALAQTMGTPGLDIFKVFNEVGIEVADATAGTQQPWVSHSPIRGDFYFSPPVAEQAPAPQSNEEREKIRELVRINAEALFNSPYQIVLGNSRGTDTIVEFFDYNDGYGRRAVYDLPKLLARNANLKFIIKQCPIFGEGSTEAASVALAAFRQDSAGKFMAFHKTLSLGVGAANKTSALAAAKNAGLDVARISKDIQSVGVTTELSQGKQLCDLFVATGLPTYLIGSQLVLGAVEAEVLEKTVIDERSAPNR
jgi:protein-disulfide isomerase